MFQVGDLVRRDNAFTQRTGRVDLITGANIRVIWNDGEIAWLYSCDLKKA